MPSGYVDSLQILADFEFLPMEPPSAQLAISAGAKKQKGGPKMNTIVSPTRGTTGLGLALTKDGGDTTTLVLI